MRIKAGTTTRRKHKKVLALAKGYRLGRSKLFRQAKEAVLKAGRNAYKDRRIKKRSFRSLWIVKINAAARDAGITYKELIANLKKVNLNINRKTLANIAEKEPKTFKELVKSINK